MWTSILTGQVHARRPNGEVFVVANNLPGINSIAFSPSGRLFVTQVLWGDALWELDLAGNNPPRKVIENMGHLNGFDFDKDGYLYGPLLYKGKVVRIDVDSGEMTILASGFKIPVAVNLDSNDNLYVADTALGRILRVDIKTGEKTLVASVEPGIDNLALNSRDELYITNMNDNALLKINTRTGAARTIVSSETSVPGGLDLIEDDGRETLLLGNLFTYSTIDGHNGEMMHIKRGLRGHFELPMSVNIQGERVVVSSWFTSGIEILDRNTHQSLTVYHGFQQPVDALELIDGTLLVAEHGTGSIIEVSEDGDRDVLVDDVPGLAPAQGTPPGYIQTGVAVSAAGNIYVTSDLNTAIYKITPQ